MLTPSRRVFVSYTHVVSRELALRVHSDLAGSGWDVFVDVGQGDDRVLEDAIVEQIGSRRNFLIVLSPGVEALLDPGSRIHREVVHALTMKLNIVPVLVKDFDSHELDDLPEPIAPLARLQGLRLYDDDAIFPHAMATLRVKYLEADDDPFTEDVPQTAAPDPGLPAAAETVPSRVEVDRGSVLVERLGEGIGKLAVMALASGRRLYRALLAVPIKYEPRRWIAWGVSLVILLVLFAAFFVGGFILSFATPHQ